MKIERKGLVPANCGCRRAESLAGRFKNRVLNPKKEDPLYNPFNVWRSMIARCTLPTHQAWDRYGGRGILVDPNWLTFEIFWKDMGPDYEPNLTLERRDNEKGYSIDNCYWATREEQGNNTRFTSWIDLPTGPITAARAGRLYGVPKSTIHYWITTGQAIERLISLTPVQNSAL